MGLFLKLGQYIVISIHQQSESTLYMRDWVNQKSGTIHAGGGLVWRRLCSQRRLTGRKSNSMRSSNKSRSRNKNANRNRNTGNVTNRVFDSSGPDSRVRGTPQQIIDKYQALARDAHLSGDRVATENFLQHSEHYSRLLGEAQRELAEQQEQQQKAHERANQNAQSSGGQHAQHVNQTGSSGAQPRAEEPQPAPARHNPPREKPKQEPVDVLGETAGDSENSLVETPENGAENSPKPRTRRRAPTKPAAKPEAEPVAAVSDKTTEDQPPIS